MPDLGFTSACRCDEVIQVAVLDHRLLPVLHQPCCQSCANPAQFERVLPSGPLLCLLPLLGSYR